MSVGGMADSLHVLLFCRISNGIEVSKKNREGQTTDPIVIPLDSLID